MNLATILNKRNGFTFVLHVVPLAPSPAGHEITMEASLVRLRNILGGSAGRVCRMRPSGDFSRAYGPEEYNPARPAEP